MAIQESKRLFKKAELFFLAFLALISFGVMFATFYCDHDSHELVISSLIHSDFGAHLPLFRSFSFGDNWPPEYPLFAGPPIQYHFLFHLIVGWGERLGIPLDLTTNLLSGSGFFLILLSLYRIGSHLFNDRRVGALTTIFFLFNGSMAWIFFVMKHPTDYLSLSSVWNLSEFSAFGPWDGTPVAAFWNISVFINQRHFSLALGILFYFIERCLSLQNASLRSQVKWGIGFGVIFAFFPLFHKPVMLMAACVMISYFFLFPKVRWTVSIAGGIAFLGLILVGISPLKISSSSEAVAWYSGFMVHDQMAYDPLAIPRFIFYQIGFHFILVPFGFSLAPEQARRALLPAVLVSIVAFSLKFSQDIMANHKFLNFSFAFLQCMSAFIVVKICDLAAYRSVWVKRSLRALLVVLVLFLTISGILDWMPVKNQRLLRIKDIEADPALAWIQKNTPKKAVFLNAQYFLDPASLVGRNIFLGYGYFVSSAGYDNFARAKIYTKMFTERSPVKLKEILAENRISYVEFNDIGRNEQLSSYRQFLETNEDIYRSSFPLVYEDKTGESAHLRIYQIAANH